MVPPVLLNGVGGGLYRCHGAHPTPVGCEEGCAVLKVPPTHRPSTWRPPGACEMGLWVVTHHRGCFRRSDSCGNHPLGVSISGRGWLLWANPPTQSNETAAGTSEKQHYLISVESF